MNWIKLRNPTNRNTDCRELVITGITMIFSYETMVAVGIPGKGWFRQENDFSGTTCRHIREAVPSPTTPVPEEELYRMAANAVRHAALRDLKEELVGVPEDSREMVR